MNRIRLLTALALTCLAFGTAHAADDALWKVGLAARDATPEHPVHLAGYASRNKPFEQVVHPLFVKALALEDSEGQIGLIITSDLIGFRNSVGERICERIHEQAGLERSRIMLNSSHTHTGPTIFLSADDAGDNMSPEDVQRTIAHTQRLIDLCVEAGLEALSNRKPARLSHGIGVCRFAMNRREWTPQGIKLGFNPSGYVDRSVPVLRIDNPDGTIRGVLIGAAVHNTTLGGQDYVVSGDYAGAAQQFVQQQHPGVQALFMLGCAGSANPHPRGTLADVESHGTELGTEVCRVIETKLTPIRGPLRIVMETVDLPLQEPPSREELARMVSQPGSWQPFIARKMIQILESGESLPETFEYPIAVWRFGGDLTLVGLAGEVVNEYVPLIEHAVGARPLWIAAYCNHVFGYVPTAQILKDGGYETRGVYYGTVGLFSKDAEGVLVNKVKELVERTNSPVSE